MLQFAGVSSGALMQCCRLEPFGFSPKISTPVENTVEKQVKRSRSARNSLVLLCFLAGETRGAAI